MMMCLFSVSFMRFASSCLDSISYALPTDKTRVSNCALKLDATFCRSVSAFSNFSLSQQKCTRARATYTLMPYILLSKYCLSSFWSDTDNCNRFTGHFFDKDNVVLCIGGQIVEVFYIGYVILPTRDSFVNWVSLSKFGCISGEERDFFAINFISSADFYFIKSC